MYNKNNQKFSIILSIFIQNICYNFKYQKKESVMLEFLKRRLKSEKGAMDKILVTLLLVIVGVGAVVGLSTWINTETESVQTAATSKIQSVTTDAAAE